MGYVLRGKYLAVLGLALVFGPGARLWDLVTGNTLMIQTMKMNEGSDNVHLYKLL